MKGSSVRTNLVLLLLLLLKCRHIRIIKCSHFVNCFFPVLVLFDIRLNDFVVPMLCSLNVVISQKLNVVIS
jgi:hypothetical protein